MQMCSARRRNGITGHIVFVLRARLTLRRSSRDALTVAVFDAYLDFRKENSFFKVFTKKEG